MQHMIALFKKILTLKKITLLFLVKLISTCIEVQREKEVLK